jgi:hypothetical protein
VACLVGRLKQMFLADAIVCEALEANQMTHLFVSAH